MADEKRNKASLDEATKTLTGVANSPTTPKTIKKNIVDIVAGLESGEYSMSVRAANAISTLDDITQDPNMPSFVRVTLWTAKSSNFHKRRYYG